MDTDKTFIFLKKCNLSRSKVFKLYSCYNDSSIEVIILYNNSANKVEINEHDITHFARIFEIEVEEYRCSLLSYFLENISSIDMDVNDDQLILYKNKKIKFFYKTCEKIDYESTVEKLLDSGYNHIHQLEQQVSELELLQNLATDNLNKMKNTLSEYVEEVRTRENKLYSCFLNVLNEKKKRIQFLTEILEAKGEDLDNINSKRHSNELKENVQNKKQKTRKEVISDSEYESEPSSESSYDTDCEKSQKTTNEGGQSLEMGLLDFDEPSCSTQPLPQRQKQSKSMFNVVTVTCTPKSESDNKVEIENINIQTPFDQDSPTVNFSTQDLFNRM